MTEENQILITLDFRCKRCGAPFIQPSMIQSTIDLFSHKGTTHHCESGGIGIGELVGFHEPCSHSPNALNESHKAVI